MDIFESTLVLLHCSRKRLDPDRSSPKFINDGEKDLAIHLIEPRRIDTQPSQRLLRNSLGNTALRLDLSVIAHPLDQSVDNTGGPASTAGNFPGPL